MDGFSDTEGTDDTVSEGTNVLSREFKAYKHITCKDSMFFSMSVQVTGVCFMIKSLNEKIQQYDQMTSHRLWISLAFETSW